MLYFPLFHQLGLPELPRGGGGGIGALDRPIGSLVPGGVGANVFRLLLATLVGSASRGA